MTRSLVETQFGPNAAAYATSAVHAAGESLAMLVDMAKPEPTWQALDVATGAGHMAAAFAPRVARVVASDITDEMLGEARRLAEARGLANLETATARADRLPFPNQSFDLVSCRLAAHHFPDPAAFVSEAARVLKPGGTFALVDNVSPDAAALPGLDRAGLREAGVAYNLFEKLRDPSHLRALTTAEWLEIIDDAGLVPGEHQVIRKEMAFGPWVRRMRCDEATTARLAGMISATGADDRGALVRFLMPRREGAETWISLRELVLVARKSG